MVEYWDGNGVTVQALKAEVIKLGTEFPDKLVSCVYSMHGEPVCIVGQAIFNITGKVVDNDIWFGQLRGSNKWVKALGGADVETVDCGFSEEDHRAFNFVAGVQDLQDRAHTWGAALSRGLGSLII